MTQMKARSSLLRRADVCLYGAKRSGRNRVVCEADNEALLGASAA